MKNNLKINDSVIIRDEYHNGTKGRIYDFIKAGDSFLYTVWTGSQMLKNLPRRNLILCNNDLTWDE